MSGIGDGGGSNSLPNTYIKLQYRCRARLLILNKSKRSAGTSRPKPYILNNRQKQVLAENTKTAQGFKGVPILSLKGAFE